MERKPLGHGDDRVAAIGQGTWDWPERGARLDEAIRALRAGIDAGLTHIDTAEMYGSGKVEELLGEALRGVARDRIFLTSKVLPENATYEGTIAACDRSLRRLRTDRLDLYLLHWPSRHPIEGTMRAFHTLAQTGKIRYAGVSNFDLDGMQETEPFLTEVPLVANQILYHLHARTAEARVIPYCRSRGIAVIGYTPFGRGRFPREAAQPNGVLGTIARKHAKTPRQVILNFLTRDPELFAIPKASKVEHVKENAGASGWRLDESDRSAIDEAFPVNDGPLPTL